MIHLGYIYKELLGNDADVSDSRAAGRTFVFYTHCCVCVIYLYALAIYARKMLEEMFFLIHDITHLEISRAAHAMQIYSECV